MIDAIRFVNVQSYKDVTFNFSSGINVLEAPNETGKSIMFKVFRRMCDINWYGRSEKKALIRRGCTKGLVAISVKHQGDDNKYLVQFNMFSTFQTYKLIVNKEIVGEWKQDTIPDEVALVLGWYYDFNSARLLNLLDQELDMPFVNNNNKSNYEIMKFITHDSDLDTARYNLNQWIDELTRLLSDADSRKLRLEGELSSLQEIDEYKIEQNIAVKEKSLNESKVYANLLKSLCDINSLSKPVCEVRDNDRIDLSIRIVEQLYQFGLLLQDVVKLRKPQFNIVNTNKIEQEINIVKSYNNIKFNLNNIKKLLKDKQVVEMKIKNTKEHIEDFEREHQFCPLCGSQFNN